MKRLIMLLVALSLAAVLTACGDDDSEEESAEDNQDGQPSEEMPKPDLEDVPDVVAKVNGEEIDKDEFAETYKGQFQQMAMQAQMTGEEIDQDKMKQQTVEGLVGNKLLIQEADDRDYEASQEEIDDTLDELSEQQPQDFDSTDEFIDALEEQGLDEDEVMDQMETQVKLDKLIADESGDLEPTEDELKDAYEQWKEQQEQMSDDGGDDSEVASFDEMKSQLKESVEQQKEAEATQAIVDDLREEADVTVNL